MKTGSTGALCFVSVEHLITTPRGLARLKIPPLVGSALVLASLIGGIVYSVSLLSEPATGWVEKATYSIQQLKQKLEQLGLQKAAVYSNDAIVERFTSATATTTWTPMTTPMSVNTVRKRW